MEQKTCNIIMCCKNTENGESAREAIINYMSKECNWPKEAYDEQVLTRIIEAAMFDFIDTCDKPSTFLRLCQDIFGAKNDFDRIAIAFSLIKAVDDDKYINGFTHELITRAKEDLL